MPVALLLEGETAQVHVHFNPQNRRAGVGAAGLLRDADRDVRKGITGKYLLVELRLRGRPRGFFAGGGKITSPRLHRRV